MEEGMEVEPEEVLMEDEEELQETCHELKDKLVQVSSERRQKLEEVQRLTRKVERLINEQKNNQPGILKEDVADNENEKDAKKDGMVMALSTDAALIFPEEIWLMIFGNISDSKDLWNLCNATPYFDNLLYPWKTGWMLGQALPYFYHRLPLDKLLGCRQVCKSWDSALNNFFEEHPSIRPHNRDNFDPQRLDFVDPMTELGLRDEHMAINLTYFVNLSLPIQYPEIPPLPKTPGRSPFIGRYLVLALDGYFGTNDTDDEDEQIRSRLDRLSNFLTEVGKEIWYLRLEFPGIDFEASLHPRITQFITVDLFRLLPNLRELNTGPPVEGFIDPLPEPGALPPAPKLETLQAYHRESFDPMTGLLLTRYHAQLRKLSLAVGADCFIDFHNLEWPALQELYLTSINNGRFALRITKLSGLRMPLLSKLGLNLFGDDTCLKFHQVIQLIRELSTTTRLNTVRLDGGGGFHRLLEGRQKQLGDHAPASIKTLEVGWPYLGLKDKPPNYNFILQYFPLVENLHLFLNLSHPHNENHINLAYGEECLKLAEDNGFQEGFEIVEVNKYAYRGEMYSSNIWKLFHQLKVFSFQRDVYTRHEYQEYQEKLKRNSASRAVPSAVPE